MKLGICSKCGKTGEVRQHHYRGYGVDETIPYCRSCDIKAHHKARIEGRCNLNPKEAHYMTAKSFRIRNIKGFMLSSRTLMKDVQLIEKIELNKNNHKIDVRSYFHDHGRHKIYNINEIGD